MIEEKKYASFTYYYYYLIYIYIKENLLKILFLNSYLCKNKQIHKKHTFNSTI